MSGKGEGMKKGVPATHNKMNETVGLGATEGIFVQTVDYKGVVGIMWYITQFGSVLNIKTEPN